MVTTGEGLCPIISAWSYKALEREANKEDDVEEAKFYLKWSYCETPYFAYGEEYFEDVNKVFLERMETLTTRKQTEKEVRLRINAMERVMHNLDMDGMFGTGKKVTKSKTIFPTDDALFKTIYLAMCDITEKWTGAGWNLGQPLDQLCIYFGDRISPSDLE